jgi:hypothetical protein
MSRERVDLWRVSMMRAARTEAISLLDSVAGYFNRQDDGSFINSLDIDSDKYSLNYKAAQRFIRCADSIIRDLYSRDIERREGVPGSRAPLTNNQYDNSNKACISELNYYIINSDSLFNSAAASDSGLLNIQNSSKISMLDVVSRIIFEAHQLASSLSSSESAFTFGKLNNIDFITFLVPFWFPLLLSLMIKFIVDFSSISLYLKEAIRMLKPSKLKK